MISQDLCFFHCFLEESQRFPFLITNTVVGDDVCEIVESKRSHFSERRVKEMLEERLHRAINAGRHVVSGLCTLHYINYNN